MKTVFAAASLAVLAACAPTPPPREVQAAAAAGRQCFHANNANGFRNATRESVELTVSSNEVYHVELFGSCMGLEEAVGVAVRARGGSSWVCEGADVELVVPVANIGPRQCPARSLRRLTAAELQARRQGR